MSNTLDNPLCSDNTVKSRIIGVGLWMIVVIGILIPIVFLRSGVSVRPNTFEFIQRWLSPPYIYLVLNLVIISIVASPRLLHSFLWVFNYFKEAKKGYNEATTIRVGDASKPSSPPSSVVTTTTTTVTTSSDDHFYQGWHDFIHDQAPTSLSLPLEREPFDKPWPDIVDRVESSIKTPNSFDGREIMEERNLIKKVKSSLPSNEIKKSSQVNKSNSLKSTWNATKGREKLVSPLNFIGNNLNADDTLEGTWKTIMKGGDTISSPSLIRNKGGCAYTNLKREEIASPLSLIGTDENNFTSEFNEVETMDATWKAIMEGGDDDFPPSTLSTSESERISLPSKLISPRVPRQDALAAWRELRKSETFNETVSARQRAGMRRDPSLSLDDLNCRVESFIKNFNHQMLLQRQESEQRFSEMINSGGY